MALRGKDTTPGAGSPWMRGVESDKLRVDPPSFSGDPDLSGSPVGSRRERRYEPAYGSSRSVSLEQSIGIGYLLVAVVLAILSSASVLVTQRGFGHSWDEALYYKPAQQAISWWADFLKGDATLLSSTSINRAWGERLDSEDPLHPEIAPLPKILLGAGERWAGEWLGDPLLGMRAPIAVLFGLTVAMAFLFGAMQFGWLGGYAAALFYWLTPRVFGHAHMAASETILGFCVALTSILFVAATRRSWIAPFAGLVFGLAIATKVTALVLPLPLFVWAQIYRRRESGPAMFWMLFLGPAVAFALWPWLWHDGLRRFFSYLLFYLEHQATAVYYLGQVWGFVHGPPAPWHYPWVITGIGAPEWLLLLAVIGIVRALVQVTRRPVLVLMLVLALMWPAITSLPNSPKYDGERLFFPAFFFIAILAGGGLTAIFDWRNRRSSYYEPTTSPLGWVLLILIAGWGVADLWLSNPNQLNYFNYVIGGPKGALDRGFETSYWGEALNDDCTAYLNEEMKPGNKVQVMAMNELCFENLQQWGKLSKETDFHASGADANWLILQVRQGFLGRYEKSIRASGKPSKVFSAQGVPRIEIYNKAILGSGKIHAAVSQVRSIAENLTSASQSWRVPVADSQATTVTQPIDAASSSTEQTTTPQ